MNKPEIIPQDDVAGPRARHKTTQVMVGNVAVGGGAPIVVQSMTNTDTADVEGTVQQVRALARAGSELVRVRSQTIYYVLTRIKGICKVYLDRQRMAEVA